MQDTSRGSMETKSVIERKVQARDVLGWIAILSAAATFGKYVLGAIGHAYAFVKTPDGMAAMLLVVVCISVLTLVIVLLRR